MRIRVICLLLLAVGMVFLSAPSFAQVGAPTTTVPTIAPLSCPPTSSLSALG